MPLLGEGAAHPNAPLEMTKEAFPFSFFLTAKKWPTGRSSLEPCVRERERQRGRDAVQLGREGREITGTTIEGKESGPVRTCPRRFSLNRLGRHCRPP